jgi:hypothetical protein
MPAADLSFLPEIREKPCFGPRKSALGIENVMQLNELSSIRSSRQTAEFEGRNWVGSGMAAEFGSALPPCPISMTSHFIIDNMRILCYIIQ